MKFELLIIYALRHQPSSNPLYMDLGLKWSANCLRETTLSDFIDRSVIRRQEKSLKLAKRLTEEKFMLIDVYTKNKHWLVALKLNGEWLDCEKLNEFKE